MQLKLNLATMIVLLCVASSGAMAQAPAASESTAALKNGVVRIGLLQPKVDFGAQSASMPNAAEMMRGALKQYLVGPTVEVVPLEALNPIQASAEAAAKGCQYVLYTSISQKKGGGGFGLLHGAAAMSNMVPVIGMSGRTGAVVAAAATQSALQGAQQLATAVKAKSEVSLEYNLSNSKGENVIGNTEKVKAQSDGQDVITPLIEHATTAVLQTVMKRN
jgi:hypothetical protein